MTNDNCDRKSKCEDYKYNHCDGCNGNKISSEDFIKAFGNGVKPIDVQSVGIFNKSGDLIKRNLAIAYAKSGLVRKIDGEDWIRISEVKQSLNDVPTVEPDMAQVLAYESGKASVERPQGEWIPVSEGLPEEKLFNPTGSDFGFDFEEVLCTTIWGDVRAYKFGKPIGHDKPHFWLGGGIMDEYVIAWQYKPEPYKEGGAE